MDKYDVMRAVEDLSQPDRDEVIRWGIRTFSVLKRPRGSDAKEPTIKEKVLAALTYESVRLRSLVELVYGEYNASKRQLVHSRLKELIEDSLVVRPSYGCYCLAPKTTASEEAA